MFEKNKLSKIFFLSLAMAILTQPAKADISRFEPELGLPVVGTVALATTPVTFFAVTPKKYINDSVNSESTSLKNIEALPPVGAAIMISSEPVIIQNQVSKNIFTANIPNERGGYSTVMLQKSGNRFIELPEAIYLGFPVVSR